MKTANTICHILNLIAAGVAAYYSGEIGRAASCLVFITSGVGAFVATQVISPGVPDEKQNNNKT